MSPHNNLQPEPTLTRLFHHYRIWVWGAITASVLICGAISWLHFHQQGLLRQATAELAAIRQARIDLARGLLHASLAGDAGSPFDREQGVALLNQATASLERIILNSRLHATNPETLSSFRKSVRQFQLRLNDRSPVRGGQPHWEADVRLLFYDIERQSGLIDARVQRELHHRYARLNTVFMVIIAGAAVLLAGFCSAIYIAGRNQAENSSAITEKELHFRSYFERAMVGMAATSPDKGWLEVNPALCNILGYDADEFAGKSWADLTHPDDLAADAALFEGVRAGIQDGYSMEKRFVRKGGGAVWTRTAVQAVRNPDGALSYCVAIIEDISEIKRDEAALRRSEENYRLLFQSNPLPMWIYDRGTLAFLEVNNAAIAHYGYSREEFLGMTIKDIRPAEDLPRLMGSLQTVPAGMDNSGEWRHLRRDGSVIDVEITTSPLQFEGRGAKLVLAHDITERKVAARERAKLETQLLQLQKMESIGRLAGGVAHDFNNMLTVILGSVELMKMRLSGDDPVMGNLLDIERAGCRSRDITRQLLAFSRQQIIEPVSLDLNSQIEETRHTLARLIGEDVVLRFLPAHDLWNVKLDPSQFNQIIMNLAVNARDAMPDGGSLTIETANFVADDAFCRLHPDCTPGQYVLLAVSDSGVGMDRETVAHIFEPFFTTKEVGKGTGLGLATVYGIVRQNQGIIAVYTEPGRGTTFRTYLPRCTGSAETTGQGGIETTVAGSGTILVVEDDAEVRDLVGNMLEALGYTVLAAATPADAIDLVGNGGSAVNLLLSDVVMPGMKGTELRDRIAADRPDMKVLFMSGYTANVIVHHGVLDEGVNFIQKPFTLNDLSLKIRHLLHGA